jgi:dethiobiotin synthetase
VTGIGTDVGKTTVSAILATLFQADYWKPIQSGIVQSSDTAVMSTLIDVRKHHIYESVYSLQSPLSPHHAARLENKKIDPCVITPPKSNRPLIIETAGGILVPFTNEVVCLDLFKNWNYPWVVVSKNYLGSINHTLLTIEVLRGYKQHILGLVFNGESNPDSEVAITELSQLPILGRLLPEKNINSQTIQKYANLWSHSLNHILK